jgi:NTE family protein
MGALVAVLYAGGLEPEWCERLAIHLRRKTWLDFTVPRWGFIAGNRVRELVRLLTRRRRLEDLYIPVAVVATDLVRGERVVITEGPADEAVRASIAVPGIFEPLVLENRILVDGAVLEPVPVAAARSLGADFVIAVDVSNGTRHMHIGNIFDVIEQTLNIMGREFSQRQAADFVIRPDLGDMGWASFHRAAECIRCGERETEASLPALKEKLAKWHGEESRE